MAKTRILIRSSFVGASEAIVKYSLLRSRIRPTMWLYGKRSDGRGMHTKEAGEGAYLFSVLEKSTLLMSVAGNVLKP